MMGDSILANGGGQFPLTRHSAVLGLRSTDAETRQRALAAIIEGYWKPVYKYLRTRWNKDCESAKDLTQAFFLRAIEREFLADFDASRARFRTFMRVCLDRFVSHADRDASRLKRGGGVEALSLNYDVAEGELSEGISRPSEDPQTYFEREWVRELLASAVAALRLACQAKNKLIALQLFEEYDLARAESDQRMTYTQLAAKFAISTETVTNHLAYARRVFRSIVLERIRSMTASDEEYRQEVRSVLGVDHP